MNESQLGNRSSNLAAEKGWPLPFEKKKSLSPRVTTLVGVVFGFGATWLLLITIVAVYRLTSDLFGTDPARASEAVKSLLPISAAVIGLPLIIWRLIILSRQTETAEAKTQIDRETHYTSIFSRSVDQLGQTREIKESREKNGTLDISTRTSPNIEVRLGGIHSLSRLAEESARDVGKIENMLLSYVRENSWSDRDGNTTRLALTPRPRANWQRYYRKRIVSNKNSEIFDQWSIKEIQTAEEIYNLTDSLPETRVDISESIDAIRNVSVFAVNETRHRFYECLFVGRIFNSELLAVSTFERCTFIRCHFKIDSTVGVDISESQLVKCAVSGDESNATFSRCYIASLMATRLKKTKLEMQSCRIYDSDYFGQESTEFLFVHCTIFRGWLNSVSETKIKAEHSAFVEFDFSGNSFSSSSHFDDCVFPKTEFSGGDLSDITHILPEALEHALADSDTLHPVFADRPLSWPEFVVTNDEDQNSQ